jgi:hypothetical protein
MIASPKKKKERERDMIILYQKKKMQNNIECVNALLPKIYVLANILVPLLFQLVWNKIIFVWNKIIFI